MIRAEYTKTVRGIDIYAVVAYNKDNSKQILFSGVKWQTLAFLLGAAGPTIFA